MNKPLTTDEDILEKSTTTACNNYRIERDTGLLLGDEEKMCIESYKTVQNRGFAGGRRKRTRPTKRKSKKARKTRRKKTKRSRK